MDAETMGGVAAGELYKGEMRLTPLNPMINISLTNSTTARHRVGLDIWHSKNYTGPPVKLLNH